MYLEISDMKSKKITAFFILSAYLFSVMPAAYPQNTPGKTPEPYGIEEFTTWQKDLRRFEIISFGSLPFVTFLSFWAYDIIRSAQHKGDPGYAPWPVKNPETAVPLSENEQKNIFFASIGISVGIALIDFSVRAIKRDIARKRKRVLEEKEPAVIELIPIEDGEAPKREAAQKNGADGRTAVDTTAKTDETDL